MFRTLAFTAKATATSDVTVLLDLIAVEGDLPIRFHSKGAWFFSRSTQRRLELLDLLVVPAAFTETTGRAHWEILLRARAIENQCYVLAIAQGGRHENGRETRQQHADRSLGRHYRPPAQGPGIVIGELDPARIAEVRASLPALKHRVM